MPTMTRPMPVSAALRRTLLDRLGVGASVVCLVHCLLTPFVLAGVAAYGASGGDHTAHLGFHAVVLALALPLALASAWPGYREHRDRGVLVLLGSGVALLAFSFVAHEALDALVSGSAGEVVHTGLTVVGSALLVWGHVRNYRLRARCGAHVLPHHAAHDAAGRVGTHGVDTHGVA